MDLIERQAAIDAIKDRYYKYGRFAKKDELIYALEGVPPAQLGTNLAEVGTDLISRQAALDIFDDYNVAVENGQIEAYSRDRKRLCDLPPAQPEIIRCKDCKYRMPYDWMFSETWQSQNMDDYPDDEIGCLYCDMAMKADDFCSRAERIKGEAE